MPTLVRCPHCEKKIKLDDNFDGSSIQCPHCDKSMAIRRPEAKADGEPPAKRRRRKRKPKSTSPHSGSCSGSAGSSW